MGSRSWQLPGQCHFNHMLCLLQVRNLKNLFDVTDVVDDVQGVVDETVQRTTDNLHQVHKWCNVLGYWEEAL